MVVTTGLSTKISAKEVWNMAKEYDPSIGEFKGEGENWSSKKGGVSKEEKAAKEEVSKTGEQQNVIEKETGGIKVMGKKFKDFVKAKEEPAKDEVKEEPVVTEEAKEEVVEDKSEE